MSFYDFLDISSYRGIDFDKSSDTQAKLATSECKIYY